MCTLIHSCIAAFMLAWGIPMVASAEAPRNLVELGNMLARILNSGTTVLILAGIVIYFGGVTIGLFKQSHGGKVVDLRKMLLWGVVVIFIMVSIWGILALLQETLFGRSGTNTGGSPTPSGANLQFTATPGQ